jgi:hypothetical protein
MKGPTLKNLDVAELVERFTSIALAQYTAELYGDISKYNRLYDELVEVREELKARVGDQRRALIPLYLHSNPQVRLKAALYSLAVAPAAARQVLQDISDRNEYPQAAYARQSLMALDRGDSKLA